MRLSFGIDETARLGHFAGSRKRADLRLNPWNISLFRGSQGITSCQIAAGLRVAMVNTDSPQCEPFALCDQENEYDQIIATA